MRHGHHQHQHAPSGADADAYREREWGRRFARGPFGRGRPDFGHHHGPDHDGHPPHGRGRRQGRIFDYGELRLVVLALIAERPRHGYEIIKAIEERTAGSYTPSAGVIYPTLTHLEELGHASVAEHDGKKLYAITAEGTAHLAVNQPALDTVLARIDEVRAAHGGGPAPPILRAMENLKLALRMRQARGPLTEDQIRDVAAILDAAAVAVERS